MALAKFVIIINFFYAIQTYSTQSKEIKIFFDNNLSTQYQKEISTFIIQNYKDTLPKEIITKFPEVKNIKIKIHPDKILIFIKTSQPVFKINKKYLLTKDNKILNIKEFKPAELKNIKILNFKKNKPDLKALNFLKQADPELLDEYKIVIIDKENILLKDKNNKKLSILTRAKKIPDAATIKKCKDIQNKNADDPKFKNKKMQADIRFKGQIIIGYL